MQRRAFNLHQIVDRHRFRMWIEVCKLRNQARTFSPRFAHADDAAAADIHARTTHALQRIESILIFACGDDVAIDFRRRVEIVIVVIEAGGFQLFGLAFFQHAQRAACLQPQRFDFAHHIQYRIEIALLRPAPRRTHTKSRRAIGLGEFRR